MDPIAALLDRIPLKARETTMIAAPLFHSWGFAHWSLGMLAVLDDRAQAQVRPRGDAVADRPAPGDRARRRAGDDPADPRARRRGARPLRPRRRCASVPVSRLGAARLAVRPLDGPVRRRTSTTSTARPRSRGRRSPRRRTCARRPAPPGKPPRGTVVKLFDDDGKPVAQGETGRIFVGNEHAVRGLHGRRRQGRHRRA